MDNRLISISLLNYNIFKNLLIFPKIIWERWRYEISEHEIDLCYGLWIRKRTIIPMVRVQHVDTKQGPLMNRFGLASVTISTAAGSHEIPALKRGKWLMN